MWDSAISAGKWIVNTLLKKRTEDRTIRQQKWIQVAEYIETVEKLIDETVSEFKAKQPPHGRYAQLEQMSYDFKIVLKQVYDENNKEDKLRLEDYHYALKGALYLILQGDDAILELTGAEDPFSRKGKEILSDLQAVAGQFRAFALTLKATV